MKNYQNEVVTMRKGDIPSGIWILRRLKAGAAVAVFVVLSLFVLNLNPVQAQDQIPVDVGTVDTVFYHNHSMGYWFTSPSCFIISGFRLPTAGLTLSQTLEVLRFDSIPPNYESFTDNFESLHYIQVNGDSSVVGVDIAISAGDLVGILGSHGNGEFSSFYHAGDYNTTIAGSSVTLRKISFPGNVSLDEAFEVSADSTETAHFQVVELYYDTGITASFTSIVFNDTSFVGDSAIFTNTTTLGTDYLWDFGDGNTSTLTNPTHLYSGPGNYTVTLTVTNDCFSDVATQTITIVGVEDNNSLFPAIKIFPSITNDLLVVEVTSKYNELLHLQLSNVLGQLIYHESFQDSNRFVRKELSLDGKPKGVYFVKVTLESGTVTKRVILE